MGRYWELPAEITLVGADKRAMINALDGDLVRRMRNWVAWRGGGTDCGTGSWLMDYGVGRTSGYREARMPVLTAEAEATQAAILAIPDELSSAVALFWLGALDASWVEMAAALGCTDKTCKARVERGHIQVAQEFYRRQRGELLDTTPAHGIPAAARELPASGPVVLTRHDSED